MIKYCNLELKSLQGKRLPTYKLHDQLSVVSTAMDSLLPIPRELQHSHKHWISDFTKTSQPTEIAH